MLSRIVIALLRFHGLRHCDEKASWESYYAWRTFDDVEERANLRTKTIYYCEKHYQELLTKRAQKKQRDKLKDKLKEALSKFGKGQRVLKN